MRTTVSLDDDVAAAVEQLRHERFLGLSEAVNQLVRAGLRSTTRRPPYRHRSSRMGLRLDVTNVAEAIERLEGPSTR